MWCHPLPARCIGRHWSLTPSSCGGGPFAGIDVGYYAAPNVVDWDGDGDLDLVVGNYDGEIKLWLAAADGSLELRDGGADPFAGIDVGVYAAPHVVDWDGDGDLDLVVGVDPVGIKF